MPRSYNILKARSIRTNMLLDASMAALLIWGLYAVIKPSALLNMPGDILLLSLVLLPVVAGCFFAAGVYRLWAPEDLFKEYRQINSGVFLTYGALLLLGYIFKSSHIYSRQVVLAWMVLWPTAVAVERWWYRRKQKKYGLVETRPRTIVIAGMGELAASMAEWIVENPWLGNTLLGFFDDRTTEELKGHKRLGTLDDLPDFAKSAGVSSVYICLPMRAEGKVRFLLKKLADSTCEVCFFPDITNFRQLLGAGVTHVGGYPAISLRQSPFQGMNALVKRLEDVVFSSLILLMISPVVGAIALAIKLTSKGPVIFKQWRYGVGGQPFEIYKFRTMSVVEDGYTFTAATRDDQRITSVGRFLRRNSLDELPQFINVLQGRMSIVGPRPHAVAMNEQYRGIVAGYMLRHMSKPGITGLAQIRGFRGEVDTLDKMKKRIQYDIEYLQNWSVFLDIRIILETVFGKVWRQF